MSRFKAFSVIIHIAGWLLFMAFPLVFLNSRGLGSTTGLLLQTSSYWVFCLTYIILFYLNAYIFIPGLFLKKKYVLYSIITLILLSCVYYLRPFDNLLGGYQNLVNNQTTNPGQPSPNHPEPGSRNGFPDHQRGFNPPPPSFRTNSQGNGGNPQALDSTSLFIFLMVMALSTAIKTVQQWQLTEQRAALAEADKTNAELSFLKAQINPHFLFNTLNNIYTLAVTKDDTAADSIMKLSNIMRYVTDDITEDLVPLQNEIDCISDYVELQRLRITDNTQVNFLIDGNAYGKRIAPLILMTFIENVFKYGVSQHEKSVIDIKMLINCKDISFLCRNRIFPGRIESQDTGIGIKNTIQRLVHLYPDTHVLNISNQDDHYVVQLTLQT
jgi:hypothetical protein